MRVRLLKRMTILKAASQHANARKHFHNWLAIIEFADWEEPLDITKSLNGNLLGNDSSRVIFDLGGNGRNAYRIICEYQFGQRFVHLYVCWVGSHEAYNKLNMEDKKTINLY